MATEVKMMDKPPPHMGSWSLKMKLGQKIPSTKKISKVMLIIRVPSKYHNAGLKPWFIRLRHKAILQIPSKTIKITANFKLKEGGKIKERGNKRIKSNKKTLAKTKNLGLYSFKFKICMDKIKVEKPIKQSDWGKN